MVAAADASLTSVFTGAAKTTALSTTEGGLAAPPPLAAVAATLIVAATAAAVAETLFLSSQAFLLLRTRSFLLWLVGRLAPCFLEVSVAALAAPP